MVFLFSEGPGEVCSFNSYDACVMLHKLLLYYDSVIITLFCGIVEVKRQQYGIISCCLESLARFVFGRPTGQTIVKAIGNRSGGKRRGMRNKKRIMVCVTQQKSCRRLIEAGNGLRRSESDELYIVHVFKENWRYFGQLKEADALEYLFGAAKDFGGELSVIRSGDIENTLKQFVEKHRINTIVMGESQEATSQQNMIHRMQSQGLSKLQWCIIPLVNLQENVADSEEFPTTN